jgi:Gas vesicle protein
MAQAMQHSVGSATLADLLERVLDKGIVIAGDIKIKLVEVELLTIQIRLVVCSVEKAKELGLDWWSKKPAEIDANDGRLLAAPLERIEQRLARLEHELEQRAPAVVAQPAGECRDG